MLSFQMYCIVMEPLKIILYVACEPGFYGAECALTCGNCLKSKPCNHVNGRCSRGCQEGYKGDKCDACKIIFLI